MKNTDDTANQTEPDDAMAAFWREHGDREDIMDGPHGVAMLRAARLRAGDRVLDVGCGAGATTVDAARQVGPSGTVIGVDISKPMLEFAAARVAAAGVTNVELVAADAQVYRFRDGDFDAVISRGGTMFFADPVAAFSNLARCLRSGGRLAMVVPRGPYDDPWIATILTAAAPHLGTMDVRSLDEPGPFAFVDGDRLDHILEAAGFRTIDRRVLTLPVRIGTDVDDVIGYLLAQPEVQTLLAGRSDGQVSGAVAAVRQALVPYAGPDGVVMEMSGWLVTARP